MMYLDALSAGRNPPGEINVVIEIPKGSVIKYEIDMETGALFVDRVLSTSMVYPCNYGFVPKTEEDEEDDDDNNNDPVDVFVLGNEPVVPTSIIRSKPIGVLLTEDQDGQDSKIIATPIPRIDPNFSGVIDLNDIQEHTLNQLEHFVEHHKELEEGKYVKIKGFKDNKEAKKKISDAIKKYSEHVAPK